MAGSVVKVELSPFEARVERSIAARGALPDSPEKVIDLRAVPEGHTVEEWGGLIAAVFNSGATVRVPDWFAVYFLGVLPPKWMHPGFVVCEGWERPTHFVSVEGERGEDGYQAVTYPSWEALREATGKPWHWHE